MIVSISSRSGATNTTNRNPNKHESKSIDDLPHVQAVAERMSVFKRLEQAFDAVGWSLYPLTDESLLAVHRNWQINTVCPDARAAHALLKRIGGAA